MNYPLNQEAFVLFEKYRIESYKDPKARTSRNKKYPKYTPRAATIAQGRLKQCPPHVQMGMVKRCIEVGWESVVVPKNTLDFDTKDAPKTIEYPINTKLAQRLNLDNVIKPIPKHDQKTEKEIQAAKVKVNEERAKLLEIVNLKKGTDQDPEFKKNWLDITLKHAKQEN